VLVLLILSPLVFCVVSIKVKLFRRLIKHRAMKTWESSELGASADWSQSRSGRFNEGSVWLSLVVIEARFLLRQAHIVIPVLTELKVRLIPRDGSSLMTEHFCLPRNETTGTLVQILNVRLYIH
jgi:hypothetical protein